MKRHRKQRPESFFKAALLLTILTGTPAEPASAQDESALPVTMVTTEESDNSYRSTGEMTLPYPGPVVAAQMQDFDGYNTWAPRGQDGRDPTSAAYIGQLTGVRSSPGVLELVYRVNLFWPLGSSGQIVSLVVSSPPVESGTLTRIHFRMTDPSLAISKLEGEFSLLRAADRTSTVRFDSTIRLAWFLRPFFPLESYRTHVVNRIQTALKSFARQVALSQSSVEAR